MKHHYKILLILFFCTLTLSAKEKLKYPVSEIPKELLSNAHAVVREASLKYELESLSRASETTTYAVTIFKESALDKSIFSELYDKFMKISDIELKIYDEKGKRVRKIKLEDIRDISAISGSSIYDDSRIKYIDPKYTTYPFTVEYSFSRKYNSTLHFPGWSPFDGFNTSVQHTTFEVIVPENYQFRYKEMNLNVEVKESVADGKKHYRWSYENYKAIKVEPLSPPFEMWAPLVITSPTQFMIDGYTGNHESWLSAGNFYNQLIIGKDNVPTETLEHVKSLLKDDMTDYEKISCVHQFAQKKNRYISIQDGIGGIQPFDAKTVDRLSYGDCKALTNYTMSLLNQLGFKSYYTLVNATNSTNVDPNFAKDYFNHVFLCVPMKNDTMWIECTNAHSPCGFIGGFTDDRYVLIIDDTDSKLVKTPTYNAKENSQSLNGNVEIDEYGNANAIFKITYTGAQYPDEFNLTLLDEKDRKKRIIKSIDIPNFKLNNYDLDVKFERKPSIEKSLDILIPEYCNKMGERWLIKLNTINDQSFIPPYSRGRKTPLFLQRNYSECDTISISIPEGVVVESVPESKELISEFGEYKCHVEVKDNVINYHRYLEIRKGTYPKDKYNDFRDFLEKIAKADDANAVIKQKEI